MMRRSHLFVGSVASLAMAASLACATGAQAAVPDTLALTVEGAVGTVVDGDSELNIDGDSSTAVEAVGLDGGEITVVKGPDATLPKAMGFPAYVDSATYPRAVLNVTPTSGDALTPGSADFEYGAVFRLDSTSSGQSNDNGDNIFQRGRYGDPSMFKLQVDHGYPSCLVKGADGSVLAASPIEVERQTWYAVTCSRVGSRVTVRVTSYAGEADTVSANASGPSGTLTFDPARAASVGGKLNRSGGVAKSNDQFNGAIAKTWINHLQ